MRKMRTTLMVLACACLGTAATAQVVVATAGEEFSNANGSIAFTFGQVISETIGNGSFVLTQGFHQPWADFTTHVVEMPEVQGMSLFPNPAREEAFLVMDGAPDDRSWQMMDALGRIIAHAALTTQRNALDLRPYASGLYQLRVLNADGTSAKTFQLMINH